MELFIKKSYTKTDNFEDNLRLFRACWTEHIEEGRFRVKTLLLGGATITDDLGCAFNAYVPETAFPVGIPRGEETAEYLANHITRRYEFFPCVRAYAE